MKIKQFCGHHGILCTLDSIVRDDFAIMDVSELKRSACELLVEFIESSPEGYNILFVLL